MSLNIENEIIKSSQESKYKVLRKIP